jgi:hypothetical protein
MVIAVAISGFVMVALARVVDLALAAQGAVKERNDIQARLHFASRRIAAAIATAPLKPLQAKALSTTSGDWLSPVSYSLANGILTEQDGAGARTIAEGVTDFSIASPALVAGRPVVEVGITMKGLRGESATSNFAVRLGGPA